MATAANTLLESAKCYDCYGSPGTWSLFELGLWKAYLLALDASADTSSTGLLEAAKCYDCNGDAGEWTLFKLGLLKGILLAQTPGADTSTNALLEVAKCYNCYGSWPLLSLALIKQTVIAANASADTSSNALLESVKCYDCNGGPGTWQLYLLGILKKILINKNASAGTSVTALLEASKCYDCYGGGGIWNLISLGMLSQISGSVVPPVSSLLTGLSAYWTLNESSGSARLDSLGVSTLLDNNTVTSGPGVVSNCAIFTNASSNFLNCPDNSNLSMGAGVHFTMAGWHQYQPTGFTAGILGKWAGNPGMREYHLGLDHTLGGGSYRFFLQVRNVADNANSIVIASTFGNLTPGTFYFVCAYYDGVNIGISVNNGVFDTTAFVDDVQDGTSDFYFGIGAAGDATVTSKADEWGIWKRVLTAGEITTLYNGGAGTTYPF